MKKLLLLSYIYPPAGGPGVQRVLKFSRYLRDFGWAPVVVTCAPGAEGNPDPGLLEKIPLGVNLIRVKAPEPDFYHDRWEVPLHKVARNLFRFFDFLLVPDDKVWWASRAAMAGYQAVRDQGISLILSTGPPFSAHLAAMRIARKANIPWIADFRDEWTAFNPHFTGKRFWQMKKEERMEREVIGYAARVTVIGEGMANSFLSRYPEHQHKFAVIPNGFDPADFPESAPYPAPPPGPFTLTYTGSLYSQRSPAPVLLALRRILQETPELLGKIRFLVAGKITKDVMALFRDSAFSDLVQIEGFLPHKMTLDLLSQSHLLLQIIDSVPVANRIVTGKVFEYLAAGRPILAIAPPGASGAELIRQSGAGWVLSPDDQKGIQKTILQAVRAWEMGKDPEGYRPDPEAIRGHDIRGITQRLADLMDETLRERHGENP